MCDGAWGKPPTKNHFITVDNWVSTYMDSPVIEGDEGVFDWDVETNLGDVETISGIFGLYSRWKPSAAWDVLVYVAFVTGDQIGMTLEIRATLTNDTGQAKGARYAELYA